MKNKNITRGIICFTLMTVTILFANHTFVKANTGDTIDPAAIIDWNTDGDELSLSLSDGSECYAYKQDECFDAKKRDYIALKNIADVKVTKTGFYIIDVNGEEYFFSKEDK